MGMVGGFWIAIGANNDFLMGSNIVRERFQDSKLFFVADAQYTGGMRHDETEPGPDPLRIERRKPISVLEEVPSYSYKEAKPGAEVKEEPATDSEDHGCDACRYAMVWLDGTDWSPETTQPAYAAGTYGKFFNHSEVLDASRNFD